MSYLFEQLPKESNKAFEAFSVYLNVGPERSLALVAEKLAKSEQLMKRWSARFDWPARVQAHGAHLAVAEREATEALARGKAMGWLKRREDLLETEWEMHEKCIAAAKKAFATFMEREKAWANLADIARILEVASKLGRLAAGLATDKTEIAAEVDVNFRSEVEAAIKKVYGEVIDVEVLADGHHGPTQTNDKGGAE